ncbi:MAG: oxidoreductase, partial [Magnetospirillum sp.]|nr:oxidoreductase [Magnetospirillum sp.]
MKQVLIRQGDILVEEVADPVVEPGTVLVRVAASCISVGTEMSGVAASGVPLWKRAIAQPAKVKRVVEMVAAQGLGRTLDFVKG